MSRFVGTDGKPCQLMMVPGVLVTVSVLPAVLKRLPAHHGPAYRVGLHLRQAAGYGKDEWLE
jgi:hypothetical protein